MIEPIEHNITHKEWEVQDFNDIKAYEKRYVRRKNRSPNYKISPTNFLE